MPILNLPHFNLAYDRKGSGAPVVYIHGGFASLASRLAPASAYEWTWENDFAAQTDFICYDRRGCYRSGCPESGYDLHNQAADLEALLTRLGIDSVHLVGSSAGGPIALLFAATRPARTRSLTLAGSGLGLFNPADAVTQVIQAQYDLLEKEGAAAAFAQRPAGVETSFSVLWEAEEMKERGTLDAYLAKQADLNARAAALPLEVRLRHYAAELRNMAAYWQLDVRPYAAWISVPTLVVHGANDREVPVAQGEDLARRIEHARLEVIPNASHSLVIRSAAVRQLVLEFIEPIQG